MHQDFQYIMQICSDFFSLSIKCLNAPVVTFQHLTMNGETEETRRNTGLHLDSYNRTSPSKIQTYAALKLPQDSDPNELPAKPDTNPNELPT